jgi:hypothetical protein
MVKPGHFILFGKLGKKAAIASQQPPSRSFLRFSLVFYDAVVKWKSRCSQGEPPALLRDIGLEVAYFV